MKRFNIFTRHHERNYFFSGRGFVLNYWAQDMRRRNSQKNYILKLIFMEPNRLSLEVSKIHNSLVEAKYQRESQVIIFEDSRLLSPTNSVRWGIHSVCWQGYWGWSWTRNWSFSWDLISKVFARLRSLRQRRHRHAFSRKVCMMLIRSLVLLCPLLPIMTLSIRLTSASGTRARSLEWAFSTCVRLVNGLRRSYWHILSVDVACSCMASFCLVNRGFSSISK